MAGPVRFLPAPGPRDKRGAESGGTETVSACHPADQARLLTHSEVQVIPLPQGPQSVEAASLVIILQELDTACRGSTAPSSGTRGPSNTSTAGRQVSTAQRPGAPGYNLLPRPTHTAPQHTTPHHTTPTHPRLNLKMKRQTMPRHATPHTHV